MRNIPTPHNSANIDDFAKTVLMPGDPLRAKFIAENFLEDPVLVNGVRGINGYTGMYNGKIVSVMASGMGIPSIGIYSYELFNFYNVENIIRIAARARSPTRSTFAISSSDRALAPTAITQVSSIFPGTYAPIASYKLLKQAVDFAQDAGVNYKVGNLFSSDTFYDDAASLSDWRKMGVLAVEMESAALYMNAARAGKNALCICTISDCPFTGESCTAEERQNTFTDMMEIALKIAEIND